MLGYLNEQTGKAFRPVPANLDLITARLKSGVTVDECKHIIDAKCREWRLDPDRAQYLRPETLFGRRKFEQYLGEVRSTTRGGASRRMTGMAALQELRDERLEREREEDSA